MLTNILLIVSFGINLAILALLVLLLRKNAKGSVTVESELQNIANGRKQIEFLQTKFKEALEDTISKNSALVESTSNNLVKFYQDTVTTLTLNYNQNSEKLMQVLNEELRKRIAELSSANSKHLEEAKNLVNEEFKKEVAQLQSQAEKYTKEQYKKVDEKVYEIVSETAKNTVGKVINIVDHQQLVMNALEQAKKDKFFS